MRRHRRQAMVVVVPRFCSALLQGDTLQLELCAELASQQLPRDLPGGPWRCALSDIRRADLPRDAAKLLALAPLAIWYTDNFC
jgi:hypothetical protein